MTCRHWNRWDLVNEEGKRLAIWCPNCGAIRFNEWRWMRPEAVGGKPSTDGMKWVVRRHWSGE